MSYLQPPPNMSPVVVVKDFGGYVNEYAAQTEIYRRTNREVRIHECHSACTMALGLPNVCVYPNSVFKFHQAYDPRNHITNWEVSDQLFNTYPIAVRERLGTLTKQFTIIRGEELIQLGVRACSEPQPRIIIAQAKLRPLPDSMNSGGSTLSMLSSKLQGILPNIGTRPELVPNTEPRAPRTKPALPDGMLAPKIPLPPEKPSEIAQGKTPEGNASESVAPESVTPESAAPTAEPARTAGDAPLPPPRPKIIVAYTPSLPPIPMVRIIDGAEPILPAHFVPFPKQG